MRQKFSWAKNILFILGALIIGLLISFLLSKDAPAAEIRFENCQPGTWIGGVKWEWKDGIRGQYEGSTFIDIPKLELKSVGSIVVDLEPGDYAITHYRPRAGGIAPDGRRFITPAAVLDFREIEVDENPAAHYFGCD